MGPNKNKVIGWMQETTQQENEQIFGPVDGMDHVDNPRNKIRDVLKQFVLI